MGLLYLTLYVRPILLFYLGCTDLQLTNLPITVRISIRTYLYMAQCTQQFRIYRRSEICFPIHCIEVVFIQTAVP